MRAAGQEVVARAFRGGAGKNRRLDIEETLAVHKAADRLAHGGAQLEARLHLGPAQIHIAIAQTHLFAHGGVLIKLKRRRSGAVEDVDFLAQHLDFTGGHGRVERGLTARPNAATHLQHVFAAHAIGGLKMLWRIRIEHHLHDALAIAQIEEDHAAVIPAAIHPPAEGHCLVDVRGSQEPAVMAAHGGVFPCFKKCSGLSGAAGW